MPALECLPPPDHELCPQVSHSRSWLFRSGPGGPALVVLTFKVPLVFPPTFTLILLPKENFQEQKRERDVSRAQKGWYLLL